MGYGVKSLVFFFLDSIPSDCSNEVNKDSPICYVNIDVLQNSLNSSNLSSKDIYMLGNRKDTAYLTCL